MLVSCTGADCDIQFSARLSACPICGADAPALPAADPVAAHKSPRRRRRWAFLAVLVALAVWGPFRFSWFSICDQCGSVRNSSYRQLPFVGITYWTSHDVIETPLSRIAAGFVPPHEHHWLFGHGGGNSVTCALGPAGSMRRFTRDPEIVRFIELTHRFAGSNAAQHYLAYALNPDQCRQFSVWLDLNNIVDSDIDSVAAYEGWLAKASEHIADFGGILVYHGS